MNFQREYTKQKAATIAQNRGYQTMEAKEHPDVKKAEKAKGMSDVICFYLFLKVIGNNRKKFQYFMFNFRNHIKRITN